MADSEFLRRIDAHMAHTNELLAEDRRTYEAIAGAHGEALHDIRVEMRQMSLRGERLAQGYLRVLEDMSSGLEDMSDQVRANTQAVLAALDAFKSGGGPATAGA